MLRGKVGRLLNDKMPTGVAVSPAMNHGGPYPATGHPGFTAVGIPASLLRFASLRCYDAVRPHRLPAELANKNPTGKMWRLDRRQLVAGGRSRVTATASSPASLGEILGTGELLATTRTKAKGPEGRLPITAEMLLEEPSGNLFGMTQDAGMGWNPAEVGRPQFLIVSTQGGHARRRTARRSRSATTPATGRSACWCARRPQTLRAEGVVPFAGVRAAIRATAARRARRACSTACRTATTRRSRCGG